LHRERDAYRELRIDPDAEDFVLEAAYRALARHYHPDGKTPNSRRMAAINRAYALVRTPALRQAYDRERRLHPVGPGIAPVVVPPTPFEPWGRRAKDAMAEDSSSVLDFGRYAGWSLKALARHDPDYLRWLARHSSGVRYRAQIRELTPDEPELNRGAKATR
jgi:curved DNA-binding protein CbpA